MFYSTPAVVFILSGVLVKACAVRWQKYSTEMLRQSRTRRGRRRSRPCNVRTYRKYLLQSSYLCFVLVTCQVVYHCLSSHRKSCLIGYRGGLVTVSRIHILALTCGLVIWYSQIQIRSRVPARCKLTHCDWNATWCAHIRTWSGTHCEWLPVM